MKRSGIQGEQPQITLHFMPKSLHGAGPLGYLAIQLEISLHTPTPKRHVYCDFHFSESAFQ